MAPELLQNAGVERRAHERVQVAIFGRCLLQNQLEVPCQAIDISLDGLGVASTHSPAVGEVVIIYLDLIGRIEGRIVRVFENGFALQINASPRKQQKLAAHIESLKSDENFKRAGRYRPERFQPEVTKSEIRLADGSTHEIQIVNISLSGAAMRIDVKPEIGSELSLAGMQGHVIRHTDWGIAMEFATSIDRDELVENLH